MRVRDGKVCVQPHIAAAANVERIEFAVYGRSNATSWFRLPLEAAINYF